MNREGRVQSGFTIVEVLIATSVFSLALILISASFIEISKMYRQGITLRRVQQSSRFITDDLSRLARPAERIESTTITPIAGQTIHKVTFQTSGSDENTSICAYEGFGFADDASYDIRKFVNLEGVCNYHDAAGTNASAGPGESVLEPGTEFLDFVVNTIDDGDSARINITLGPEDSRIDFASGGNQDLTTGSGSGATCDPSSGGRQFCAVLPFSIVVTSRGGDG